MFMLASPLGKSKSACLYEHTLSATQVFSRSVAPTISTRQISISDALRQHSGDYSNQAAVRRVQSEVTY